MRTNAFYHDLRCWSGLGDRLLNTWSVLTIVELISPASPTLMRWSAGKNVGVQKKIIGKVRDKTASRTYDTSLFSIGGCEFINDPPKNAPNITRQRGRPSENFLVPISSELLQIYLQYDVERGHNTPARLKESSGFYGFDPELPLEEITKTYREVAKRTFPCREIDEAIPSDIESRVGIHIRMTDKLVNLENGWEMSATAWQSIEKWALRCIDRCIARSEPMFICADDHIYKDQLLKRIRAKGGNAIVVEAHNSSENQHGFDAALDLFCLSRCKRIIQFTKYSTFSLAASIIGGIPLTNLMLGNDADDNHIHFWEGVVPSLVNTEEELGWLRYKLELFKEKMF